MTHQLEEVTTQDLAEEKLGNNLYCPKCRKHALQFRLSGGNKRYFIIGCESHVDGWDYDISLDRFFHDAGSVIDWVAHLAEKFDNYTLPESFFDCIQVIVDQIDDFDEKVETTKSWLNEPKFNLLKQTCPQAEVWFGNPFKCLRWITMFGEVGKLAHDIRANAKLYFQQ